MQVLPLEPGQVTRLGHGLAVHPLSFYRDCLTDEEWDQLAPSWIESHLGTESAGLWDDDGSLKGVIGWQPKPWESDIFQISMGQITPFLAEPGIGQLAHRLYLLDELLERATAANVQHLVCRLPSEDIIGIQALERRRFVHVDGVLTFRRRVESLESCEPDSNITIRRAVADDIEILEPVASDAFEVDRFHQDPWLARDRASYAYSQWLRNSFAGTAAECVYVAEIAGKPEGFLTLTSEQVGRRKIGSIALVAVSEPYRRRGVARQLTSAARQWATEHEVDFLEVTTQTNNVPAARAYLAAGFRFVASRVTLAWGEG